MPSTFIHIKQGVVTNPRSLDNLLTQLSDGRHELKATKNNKRSLSQNAYLHGIVIPMVFDGLRDAGFDTVRTHDDAKVIIKELFLKHEVTNGSETFKITRGTHELTTVEMMDFIAEVQKWGAEYLGINIPDPSEQTLINF